MRCSAFISFKSDFRLYKHQSNVFPLKKKRRSGKWKYSEKNVNISEAFAITHNFLDQIVNVEYCQHTLSNFQIHHYFDVVISIIYFQMSNVQCETNQNIFV